jgi:hypothetical protein
MIISDTIPWEISQMAPQNLLNDVLSLVRKLTGFEQTQRAPLDQLSLRSSGE